MHHNDDERRWAWAKLHAYGFVLGGLALLAAADLIHPANTDLARLAGEVPAGQAWWLVGTVVSGLLLLGGLLFTDRVAETAGLALLTLAVAAQSITALSLLGWTDFTLTRFTILAMLAALLWARISVLWSRDGLAVTIAPRDKRRRRR